MKVRAPFVGSLLFACTVSASAADVYNLLRLDNLGGAAGTRSVGVGISVGSGVPFGSSITSKGKRAAVQWVDGKPRKLANVGTLSTEPLAAAPSSGVLVGIYGDSTLPVAWNVSGPGTSLKLKPLIAGKQSVAKGVNDSGLVVGGGYSPDTLVNKAVFWSLPSTKPKELALPPGTATSGATAVSNNGAIVGYAQIGSALVPQVWASRGKAPTSLPYPGVGAVPTAINASGVIAGWTEIAGGAYKPMVWSGGTYTQLQTLDGTDAFAYAINDSGVVVGWARPDAPGRAVMWENAAIIDINTRLSEAAKAEGWVLQSASGIDNVGRIIAQGRHPDGQVYPVLLTPAN